MEAIILVALYFIPTLIALKRGHHNAGAIIIVNLFLGWTFLGWIVALAMSAGEVHEAHA